MKKVLAVAILCLAACLAEAQQVGSPVTLHYAGAVANLPTPSNGNGEFWVVVDGASASPCTIGGSNHVAICRSNGTTWGVPTGTGGGNQSGSTSASHLTYASGTNTLGDVVGSSVDSSGNITVGGPKGIIGSLPLVSSFPGSPVAGQMIWLRAPLIYPNGIFEYSGGQWISLVGDTLNGLQVQISWNINEIAFDMIPDGFQLTTGTPSSTSIVVDASDISGWRSSLTFGDPAVTTLSFPNLTNLSGGAASLSIGVNTLTSLSLPVLADLSGAYISGVGAVELGIEGTALTSLTFPSLANISGQNARLYIQNNSSLTSVSLPALTQITGASTELYWTGNAFTVASVNSILSTFVATGAANGQQLLLDSQTPPAPPTGPVGSANLAIDTPGTCTADGTWTTASVCGTTDATGTFTCTALVPSAVALTTAGVGCPASTNAPTTGTGGLSGMTLNFNTADMDTLLGRTWGVTTDVEAWP